MSDILSIIVTNVMAVGIVGFLLRLWVDRRLEHSLSRELEKFKTELTKEVTRHTVQTTWNHAKRMELFAQLYEHMIDADFELKALLMNSKIGQQDLIRDRAYKFSEKYLQVNACLHKNELFLEESLVSEIRAAYKPYVDFSLLAMTDTFDDKTVRAQLPERMEEICSVGDDPRKQVVALFRKYAGLT